jgi:hypothetical protein
MKHSQIDPPDRDNATLKPGKSAQKQQPPSPPGRRGLWGLNSDSSGQFSLSFGIGASNLQGGKARSVSLFDNTRVACASRRSPDRDTDQPRAAASHVCKTTLLRKGQRHPPPPHCGEGERLAQFSFRFDTGASNWAISAVCGALPLKVSTLPSTEITTRSPSLISPARIISDSGSCR